MWLHHGEHLYEMRLIITQGPQHIILPIMSLVGFLPL